MENLTIHAAVLAALGLIIWAAKIHFGRKKESLECPRCHAAGNLLTFSLHNESEKICPTCADGEAREIGLRTY